MHELGIVKYIAKTVKQTAEENRAARVSAVILEVGEVSGILPDYLTDCWNYFRVKTPGLEEAELKLVTIPAVTWCETCEDTYETVRYGRTCPYCGGGKTWLIQGNETRIREIEVPEESGAIRESGETGKPEETGEPEETGKPDETEVPE